LVYKGRKIQTLMPITGLVLSGLFPDADALELTGQAHYRLGWQIDDQEAQVSELILHPHIGARLSNNFNLSARAILRADQQDRLEPGQATQSTSSKWNQRWYVNDNIDFELRELYADGYLGSWNLRLGKQQLAWGQADSIRILDIVNPINYREFILQDQESLRIPLWMVNTDISVSGGSLQLLWIPDTTYDEMPQGNATYTFTSKDYIPVPPGNIAVTLLPLAKPDSPWQDSEYGLRWQSFVAGWDLSLNYLYHYIDHPSFYIVSTGGGVIVRPQYHRSHLFGGSLSSAVGDVVTRFEVGYETDGYWLASTDTEPDGVADSPSLAYLVGVDYSGLGTALISFQLYQLFLTDYNNSIIRSAARTQVSVVLKQPLLNQSLNIDAKLVHSTTGKDGLVQLQADYLLTASMQIQLGLDMFYGSDEKLFGQFADTNRLKLKFTENF